ncbi:MAG: hypothetical protein ACRDGI_10060 [Candidatus Limnocylindrales bacterium]
MTAFDAAELRPEVPALSLEAVDGTPLAFFDGPDGTQVPQRVIDAVVGYRTSNASDGGAFVTSQRSLTFHLSTPSLPG